MADNASPSQNADEEEWPDHWPEWVVQTLDEMEKIERHFPSTLMKNTPAWVDRMSLRVIQYMHPQAEIKYDASGPSFLGAMLGHLMWLLESEDGIWALTNRFFEAAEEFDATLQKKLGKTKYEKRMLRIERSGAIEEFERMTRSFLRLLIRKRRIMLNCISLTTKQNIIEQQQFFAAYADALNNPPMDQTGALTKEKSTGVSSIYLLMVLNWKVVSRFKSTASCYTWLCTLLGQNVVGNEDRIQKMCYRFGVNFSRRKRKQRKKKRRNRK